MVRNVAMRSATTVRESADTEEVPDAAPAISKPGMSTFTIGRLQIPTPPVRVLSATRSTHLIMVPQRTHLASGGFIPLHRLVSPIRLKEN